MIKLKVKYGLNLSGAYKCNVFDGYGEKEVITKYSRLKQDMADIINDLNIFYEANKEVLQQHPTVDMYLELITAENRNYILREAYTEQETLDGHIHADITYVLKRIIREDEFPIYVTDVECSRVHATMSLDEESGEVRRYLICNGSRVVLKLHPDTYA